MSLDNCSRNLQVNNDCFSYMEVHRALQLYTGWIFAVYGGKDRAVLGTHCAPERKDLQIINQSNFYIIINAGCVSLPKEDPLPGPPSTNISGVARVSGATTASLFNSKIVVLNHCQHCGKDDVLPSSGEFMT